MLHYGQDDVRSPGLLSTARLTMSNSLSFPSALEWPIACLVPGARGGNDLRWPVRRTPP